MQRICTPALDTRCAPTQSRCSLRLRIRFRIASPSACSLPRQTGRDLRADRGALCKLSHGYHPPSVAVACFGRTCKVRCPHCLSPAPSPTPGSAAALKRSGKCMFCAGDWRSGELADMMLACVGSPCGDVLRRPFLVAPGAASRS
jgi:hypothetical protein